MIAVNSETLWSMLVKDGFSREACCVSNHCGLFLCETRPGSLSNLNSELCEGLKRTRSLESTSAGVQWSFAVATFCDLSDMIINKVKFQNCLLLLQNCCVCNLKETVFSVQTWINNASVVIKNTTTHDNAVYSY